MPAIDESFVKLFGSTPQTFSPINTGAGTSRGTADVVTATFNPRGASHVAIENDKKAAQQKIVDDENRRKAELDQQAELQRQQAAIDAQNAQIAQSQAAWDAQQAAPAPVAVAAPAPDPYASFYSLNSRQQQKAQRNAGAAQRRGIIVPPAGYTPALQPVAAAAAPLGPRPQLVAAPVAPAESEMITRQQLADRQAKEQEDRYMASWNQQVAALGPGIAPPPRPTFPTSGGDYGEGGGGMVANPWYVVPDNTYVSQSYNNLMGTSGTAANKGMLV